MAFNPAKYFLGTNSSEGFVSSFDKCYSCEDNWKTFIIKGGPGTGKSSFMKSLQTYAEKEGIEYEIFPCSSDPNSLDAVIFPCKKLVVLDGTSPHIVEPVFPGCCEQILNFSDFWDRRKLEKTREEITFYTLKNRRQHRQASGYLAAAGKIIENNLSIVNQAIKKEKLDIFSKKLCKKYINKKGEKAYEWIRYLGGVTPFGVADYSSSAVENIKTVVPIKDDFGGVSSLVMENIRAFALSQNHQIIKVPNSFLPSKITDHIIIPKLSLSFVSITPYQSPKTNGRIIHSSRFLDKAILNENKKTIKENKKIINNIIDLGVSTLKQAKTTHDILEEYYIGAMDFKKSENLLNEFIKTNLQ